jgi:hypothetical protein
MAQALTSITSLPSTALQEIFSYCTPSSNIPKVSPHFHAIYQKTMCSIGKDFIRKIDRTVSCPAILPNPNDLCSDRQGLEVAQSILKKAQQVWASFSPSVRDQFPKFSLQNLCHDVSLLNKLFAAELITLCESTIPTTLSNSTPEEKISFLTTIIELSLQGKSLQSLPDSIGNLSALTNLYLDNNQLLALPDSIGNLSALTDLYLDDNQLLALPDSIGNLSALSILWLVNNKLQTLPDSIGNLSALSHMYLENNQLLALPNSIGNLSALTTISLENNQLQTLPNSIGNLSVLTNLWLDDNHLQELPDSIGNLSALTKLRLDNNSLSLLSPSIVNCESLRVVSLRNNKLQKLPPKFDTLHLSTLHVDGNPDLANDVDSVRMIKTLRQSKCKVNCDKEVETALLQLS